MSSGPPPLGAHGGGHAVHDRAAEPVALHAGFEQDPAQGQAGRFAQHAEGSDDPVFEPADLVARRRGGE